MANRMKILVGYDGSECADAALDDLLMAGLPSDAQIVRRGRARQLFSRGRV
jgi:hypothetical protein